MKKLLLAIALVSLYSSSYAALHMEVQNMAYNVPSDLFVIKEDYKKEHSNGVLMFPRGVQTSIVFYSDGGSDGDGYVTIGTTDWQNYCQVTFHRHSEGLSGDNFDAGVAQIKNFRCALSWLNSNTCRLQIESPN
ncbi:MAG TPA: hypothetical protein VJB02_00730 [Coxiellaceae bacterium]|nr:hypothetical protein [Coxiellaceae bacterium]